MLKHSIEHRSIHHLKSERAIFTDKVIKIIWKPYHMQSRGKKKQKKNIAYDSKYIIPIARNGCGTITKKSLSEFVERWMEVNFEGFIKK